ncbi:MAG: tetratricopeptide repeat protein [Candidatus Eisenbacteria bacterium]
MLIALLLCAIPVRTAAREPSDTDFIEYLQKSNLTHLYAAELRNRCLEANDLAACNQYLAFLEHNRETDRAIAFTDSLKREDSHADLAIRLMKASALVDASRYSESVEILDEFIASLPPRDFLIQAAFLRARCRFELGQVDEALLNLRSVERFAAASQAAVFAVLLGACEEAKGNLARAETLYQEALEQEGSRDAAIGLLRCRLKQGRVAGFFDLRTDMMSRGTALPPGPSREIAIAVGELIPEVWHVLAGPVMADCGPRSDACRALVTSVVQIAESGEPVKAYCDSLLALDLPPDLKQRVRYAWALSLAESTWAADTLASLAKRATQPDLKLRYASAAITPASGQVRPALAAGLAPGILRFADRLSAGERFELASLLVDAGLNEEAVRLAGAAREGRKAYPQSVGMAMASLMERAGQTTRARDIYELVGASLIPTGYSLEGGKRAYLLMDTNSASAGTEGLSTELERIASEGASDLELGGLFERLKDFERASKHYRRAVASPQEGTHPDVIKAKLIVSLGRQWMATGDDTARREAIELTDQIADSPEVSPAAVRAALEISTDWLRLDHDRAFRIAQKLSHRDDLSSGDLYESARILYTLFLERDGNVYTECVLALRGLLDEFPGSPDAPGAALLLGRAKFVAGDYVGALEAYKSCLAKYDEDEIRPLCRLGVGECYLYSGGITDALSHFKQAGNSPEAMYNIAICHELIEEDDSAQVYYRRSLAQLTDVSLAGAASLNLGLLVLEREGLDKALGELDSPLPATRQQLSIVRRVVRAYGLGLVGYRVLAVEELTRVASEGGMFACEALILAASLAGQDDPTAASSLLEPGRERCDEIFGVFRLLEDRAAYACSGSSLKLCKQERMAFKERFPLAERSHRGLDIRTLLLLFREGEGDSASVMLDDLLATGRQHGLLAEAIYRKGIEYLVAADYRNAVETFSVIERDYPDHDLYRDACFKLGTAYYMSEGYDSSAIYFELATESREASLVENAFFNLGLAREKYGDLEGAARAFWSVAVRFPLSERFERSLMRTAYSLQRAGKPAEALPIYKGILNYAGDRETAAEALYWMGESFSEMGDHLRAAVEFMRVGHEFPGEAAWAGTSWFRAGNECEAAGLTDHAVAIYERTVSRFGKRTDWGKASAERLIAIMAQDPGGESSRHEEGL